MGAILKSEKITDRIYRIPVPLVGNPLKELNSYLILGNDRPLLIDTGFRMEECRQALFAALAEHGLKPGDVDVVLTHFHSDHAGLAPEVAQEKNIYVSTIESNLINGRPDILRHRALVLEQYRQEGFSQEMLDQMGTSHPGRSYASLPGGHYENIENNGYIDAGGIRLQGLLMPGHTPGLMCFWIEEEGILFSADHILFDITPNITSWIGLMDDSLGSYLVSLDRISIYQPKLVLPAHRKTGDMHQRIVSLKDHHRLRLAEALSVIQEHPGEGAYTIAGRMKWNIRSKSWDDFPLAQKWFAVGECVSHLDYLRLRGHIRREMVDGKYAYYTV